MAAPDICSVVEYQGSKWRVTGWLRPKPNSQRQVWCTREEATHLSLYAVCGAIAPVEACREVGKVTWPEERIDELRQTALAMAGETVF